MAADQEPDIAEYLRMRRKGRAFARIQDYETFLSRVDAFFSLRALAEVRFREHPNTAYRRAGALPLDWSDIAETLRDSNRPPERLVARIARDRFADVDAIGRNLRKTLVRVREKVPVGRVQQLDAGCLRWLVRQPGRSAVEKAGLDQRVLGVVRQERFDTLENRVFKDFLLRCSDAADAYLREWGGKFHDHNTIIRVERFRRLCQSILRNEHFAGISGISQMPVPNYVLQQDSRYSKIWTDYTALVRQETVAERLWSRREEIDESYLKLSGVWPGWRSMPQTEGGHPFHTNPHAAFHSPIWFSPLDGRNPVLDNPFWRNSLALGASRPSKSEIPSVGNTRIVDLTGARIHRGLLVFGKRDNEKPHLQDFSRPNAEPPAAWLRLGQILAWAFGGRAMVPQSIPPDKTAETCLREYFEQLRAEIGGERWIVLVPDDWTPRNLEVLLSAVSGAIERSHVFLLWRSVAAALGALQQLDGAQDGDVVAVVDGQDDGSALVSLLELTDRGDGLLVPRRKSQRLHPDLFGRFPNRPTPTFNRYFAKPNDAPRTIPPDFVRQAYGFAGRADHVLVTGSLAHSPCSSSVKPPEGAVHGETFLEDGCRLFEQERARGRNIFFDELEGLFLVITRKAGIEQVAEAVPLVEPNDRFPGGAEYRSPEIRDFVLPSGEKELALYLSESKPSRTDPLKLSSTKIPKPSPEAERIVIRARLTPGQGLAECSFEFESGRLEKPVRLDLAAMKEPPRGEPRTIEEIEKRLPRGFPPDIPLVESSAELFAFVRSDLVRYTSGRGALQGDELDKARNVFVTRPIPSRPNAPVFDPRVHSPIDRLRRENVFGNAPGKGVPSEPLPTPDLFGARDDRFDVADFCSRLASDYTDSKRRGDEGERRKFAKLIAWTYRAQDASFAAFKSELLARYEASVRQDSPGFVPQEYTALANLFSDDDELRRLFAVSGNRLVRAANDRRNRIRWTHDARLLYNLLQFHPLATRHASNEGCERLMDALATLYVRRRAIPTTAGSVLRAMLFLLNRRRLSPTFFKRNDWDFDKEKPPSWIDRPLGFRKQDDLRCAFIAYVFGKGTLEGIPTDED